MTKDQYLRMVEQTGEEIDWDKCPPDQEDFPQSVITALNIFYSLGDRIYPDIGYVGKDFTNLPLLYKYYNIKEEIEKEWIWELIHMMEGETIRESQRQLKEQWDKIKRK